MGSFGRAFWGVLFLASAVALTLAACIYFFGVAIGSTPAGGGRAASADTALQATLPYLLALGAAGAYYLASRFLLR
jgi:hypothetical protein